MSAWFPRAPPKSRFPSSALLPFLFGGLLIQAHYWEKGTLIFKGLLGNQKVEVGYWSTKTVVGTYYLGGWSSQGFYYKTEPA